MNEFENNFTKIPKIPRSKIQWFWNKFWSQKVFFGISTFTGFASTARIMSESLSYIVPCLINDMELDEEEWESDQ